MTKGRLLSYVQNFSVLIACLHTFCRSFDTFGVKSALPCHWSKKYSFRKIFFPFFLWMSSFLTLYSGFQLTLRIHCRSILIFHIRFPIWLTSFIYSDFRYTSIGSIHDTVPNALLSDSSTEKSFRPAYMLTDGRLERAGRTKKTNHKIEMNSVASNGMNNIEGEQMISRAASIIVVGDEILWVIPSNNHVRCNYAMLQVLKLGVVSICSNGTCDLFLFLSLKFISQSCKFSSSLVWLFVWVIELYQSVVWTLQSRSEKCSQASQSLNIHCDSILFHW